VLLVEPGRSQLDLNWRMFGFPIRVHPLFWVVTAFMGWNEFRAQGMLYLLLWVGCVFVSILVHELGHAIMGRAFGSQSHIVLYSFGGLAIGSSSLRSRWQRIGVSFAGPLAGFLLFGAVVLAVAVGAPRQVGPLIDSTLSLVGLGRGMGFWLGSPLLTRAVQHLVWINLFWGLLNLLPIWPLDGGQISHDLCTWASPDNGTKAALSISAAVAGLLALNAAVAYFRNGEGLIPYLSLGDPGFEAIFFGVLALNNIFVLQQLRQHPGADRHWGGRQEEEDRMPWERDPDYWKQGRDPWRD
jgi:Zn-dependent protease